MFEVEAYDGFKIRSLLFVNDCFKIKYNEEIGHFGQH